MIQTDFLVIGGGVAGLTYAIRVARYGRVAVLFKTDSSDSSTKYAQGGIAAVHAPDDTFELHIQDTLTAGAGLCHRATVDVVVREGPQRVRELIEFGAEFDRSADDSYHLHKEGGHSKRRIYHSADATGLEIIRALLETARREPNIEFYEYSSAVDLITTQKLGLELDQPDTCLGAYVLHAPPGSTPPNVVTPFLAKRTLVSTGGAGKIYLYTSNPNVASGDGIAMCFRAGARVANMEMFQFHPTCLFHPHAKSFLITEAMRGEGARLTRLNGQSIMDKYDSRGELAPRDIVARAIDNEMKIHGDEHVFLDISHREDSFIRSHFPTIYERCLEFGIDICKEPIPVVPAAHYCCGGVVSDLHGQTNIQNLYVAGECAHTGLHGANRLASNSLLEGLVFAHRAAENSRERLDEDVLSTPIPDWDPGSAVDSDEQVVITQNWDEIRRLMWNYVGIVRSDKRLQRALRRIRTMQQEIDEYYWNFLLTPDLLELRNLSLVASLVIHSAMLRKESRGLHYNIDHPESSPAYEKDTTISPGAFMHYEGLV